MGGERGSWVKIRNKVLHLRKKVRELGNQINIDESIKNGSHTRLHVRTEYRIYSQRSISNQNLVDHSLGHFACAVYKVDIDIITCSINYLLPTFLTIVRR